MPSRNTREMQKKGLCIWCGQPRGLSPSIQYCGRHAQRVKVLKKNNIKLRKEMGLCRDCPQPLELGRTKCADCLRKAKEYSQRYDRKQTTSRSMNIS